VTGRIHELRSLDLGQTRDLLLRFAEIHEAPTVARVVREQPGRIAALHALCGGYPRTLALLFAVVSKEDPNDIQVDVERTLDLVTPL